MFFFRQRAGKGIAGHIDESIVVWTLIYHGKLANHIARSAAIVVKMYFYDNYRNSRALIGLFLLSICGQTHEFKIHATRQRAKAGSSIICYRKKQIDVSF